jgi:hypothetical protein
MKCININLLFIFRYRNDKQRIEDSIKHSNDFSKQFHYEKNKLLTNELMELFQGMNFISYKGTDIFRRQIFFIYLDLIDFYNLDNDYLTDPLIIYLENCN